MVSKLKLFLLSLTLLFTVGCSTLTDLNFWKGDVGVLGVLVIIDQEETPQERKAKAEEFRGIAQDVLSVLNGVPEDIPNLKSYLLSALSVEDKTISQQFMYHKLVDAIIAEIDLSPGAMPELTVAKESLSRLIDILNMYGPEYHI